MKKIIYASFAIVLVTFVVVGLMYLSVRSRQYTPNNTTNNSNNESADDITREADDPFYQVATYTFVSDNFAFEHPANWNPEVVDDETGLVNLGIPTPGIGTQTLAYDSGNYDLIVANGKTLPDIAGEGYVSLIDRPGYSRVRYDEVQNVETYEFFAPGRTDDEVVKMTVEVSLDMLPNAAFGSFLNELFGGLTVLPQ